MIRQAISCDICGTEKKQSNHWFVVQDRGGELRLSGWNSRHRTSAGAKHLCGQTCLHKLVDEFMARTIASRPQPGSESADAEVRAEATDTSLTSDAAYPLAGARTAAITASVVALPVAIHAQPEIRMGPATVPMADAQRGFGTPSRRAEAWERERAREMRAVERQPEVVSRGRFGS